MSTGTRVSAYAGVVAVTGLSGRRMARLLRVWPAVLTLVAFGLSEAGRAAGLETPLPVALTPRLNAVVTCLAATTAAMAAVVVTRRSSSTSLVWTLPVDRATAAASGFAVCVMTAMVCTALVSSPLVRLWPPEFWRAASVAASALLASSLAVLLVALTGVLAERHRALRFLRLAAVIPVFGLAYFLGTAGASSVLWTPGAVILSLAAVFSAGRVHDLRHDGETAPTGRGWSMVVPIDTALLSVWAPIVRASRQRQMAVLPLVHAVLVVSALLWAAPRSDAADLQLLALFAPIAGYASALSRGLSPQRPAHETAAGTLPSLWMPGHVAFAALLPVVAGTLVVLFGASRDAGSLLLAVVVLPTASAGFGLAAGQWLRPSLTSMSAGILTIISIAVLSVLAATAGDRVGGNKGALVAQLVGALVVVAVVVRDEGRSSWQA